MKIWHADIAKKIKELSDLLKPRGLEWWPKYVYHVTDVRNAAKILETGFLFSRIEARKRGLMIVDNASTLVMDGTRMECMEFARLYFRPRTPTQYHNEGIRPINYRSLESHCPVPVFLCFGSLRLLSMDGTKFSAGNMGRSSASYSDQRDFFLSIPFEYVFHEGPFQEDQKDTIIFHRNAEVLIPDALPVEEYLESVICRSSAELRTLMTLLPNAIVEKWEHCMHIDNRNRFYYRRWTFVDSVLTTQHWLLFRFNQNAVNMGQFDAKVTYIENGKKPRSWQGKITGNQTLKLKVPNASKGIVTLELDGDLAYKGKVIFTRTVV